LTTTAATVVAAASTTDFGTILKSLITIAKNDAIKDILPVLLAFGNNIASDTSELNIAAQLLKLQTDLLAAAPGLIKDEVKDINALLQADLQALATKATAG
jgi:hypothetical protein